MRRVGLAGLMVLMALVVTACPTAPPAGYSPPKIQSVDISPQPAQPGGTVTFVLDATDDRGVTQGFGREFLTPTGTRLNGLGVCTQELAPQGDFRHVLITITCPVPEYANNGTWRLEVRLNDGTALENLPGLEQWIPFEVAGGSDDRRPPQLIDYDISPAVVDQETTFTLTMRLRDDAPVRIGQPFAASGFLISKPFAPSSFHCSGASYSQLAPTEWQVVVPCVPRNNNSFGRSEIGLHLANVPVYDLLHHTGTVPVQVDVQPAP